MRPLRGPLRKRESHLWARHPEDFYIEPSWTSERLFEVENFNGCIWDPACGSGRIIAAARAAGHSTFASDVVQRGPADAVCSFMDIHSTHAPNIISNPPFGVAERFVSHALALAVSKVAMLLPANWVQGDKRSRWLETTPLARVLFITPRPSMPPGPAIEAGEKPGNGTTDYAWFIFDHAKQGPTQIGWLRRDAAKAIRILGTPSCASVTDGAPQMGAVTEPAPELGVAIGAGHLLPLEVAE